MESGIIEIGVDRGTLNNGLEYKAIAWSQDVLTYVTVYICPKQEADYEEVNLVALLEKNGLIVIQTESPNIAVRKYVSDLGKTVWAINLLVGDEDNIFIEDFFNFEPSQYKNNETESN